MQLYELDPEDLRMDNSGLGQLCLIYTLIKNSGGELKLLKPTPRIQSLMSITKLDTVFESFESEAEALQSMFMRSIATIRPREPN